MNLAAFGLIYLPHCAQIKGIGNQRVERIGRDRNHAPTPYRSRSPIQCIR